MGERGQFFYCTSCGAKLESDENTPLGTMQICGYCGNFGGRKDKVSKHRDIKYEDLQKEAEEVQDILAAARRPKYEPHPDALEE